MYHLSTRIPITPHTMTAAPVLHRRRAITASGALRGEPHLPPSRARIALWQGDDMRLTPLVLHELRTASRDPHAIAFALLPLFLYAAALWGLVATQTLAGTATQRSGQVRVLYEGPAELREELAALDLRIDDGPATRLRPQGPRVHVQASAQGPAWSFALTHDSTMAGAEEDLGRVREQLDALRDRRVAALAGEQTDALKPLPVKFEDASQRTLDPLRQKVLWLAAFLAAALGGLSGGIYPAIDAVVGERDRGTLETSLIAPVPRSLIVLAKLFAVTAAVAVQGLGHFVCAWMVSVPALAALEVDPPTMSLALLPWALALPGLLLTAAAAAATLLISAMFARDFATAEATTTMAYTVVCVAFAHGTILAITADEPSYSVPFSGALALALDVPTGVVEPGHAGLVFVVHLLWLVGLLAIGTAWARRESFLYGAGSSPAEGGADGR